MRLRILPYFPSDPRLRTNVMLNVLGHLENSLLLSYVLNGNPKWRHDAPKGVKRHERVDTQLLLAPTDRFVPRINREFSKNLRMGVDAGKFLARSLFPARLARSNTNSPAGDAAKAWFLTREGENYGVPSSNFAIRYSVDSGIPVHRVFHDAAFSVAHDAPYLRFRILKSLYNLQGEDVRKEHLRIEFQVGASALTTNLEALSDYGLVESEQFETKAPGHTKFRWVYTGPTDGIFSGSGVPYLQPVAQYFRTKKVATLEQVSQDLNIPVPIVIKPVDALQRYDALVGVDSIPPGTRYRIRITDRGIRVNEDFSLPFSGILTDLSHGRQYREHLPLGYARSLIVL